MLDDYFELLKSEAHKLNYRVDLDSRVNKACHHPDYVVFIQRPETIERVYTFAHEVGHCIDFKKGNLDFQRYRKDRKYRIRKEFMAWYYGYSLCIRLKIPTGIDFIKHAKYCFSTYLR